MNLRMDCRCAAGYKSASQIARRVTEAWAETNLFCAACESPSLSTAGVNAEAVDFRCTTCLATYQLKALKAWSERRVPDAGYDAMMRALRSDAIPNLLVMQYSLDWSVRNLLLIPSFFFSPRAVEKRRPLGPDARRAGWVGCNILLSEIAAVGKIRVISEGVPELANVVRARYQHVRPLASVHAKTRGWALDVLRIVNRIGRQRFSLDDVYAYEGDLAATYPGNRNVRPKIRQQLQVLRDLGLICFEGQGQYQLLRQ